jgi:hypothetical protein
MNAQEIFDTSYKHIIKQGSASYDPKMGCMYRGPDGKMCAAGPFLTDEQAASVEGLAWGEDYKSNTLRLNGIDWPYPEHRLLISDLQWCHDGSATMYDGIVSNTVFLRKFKERAKHVADKHGLTVPAVKS